MPSETTEHKTGPAVSVVIVSYQSGPTLEPCLARLAAQTFRDFETILIDNASTDGAKKRLRLVQMQLLLALPEVPTKLHHFFFDGFFQNAV